MVDNALLLNPINPEVEKNLREIKTPFTEIDPQLYRLGLSIESSKECVQVISRPHYRL